MIFERTTPDKARNEERFAAFSFWLALLALSYPFFLFVLAKVWAALTSRDLSERAQAWLTLMILPVILSCALSFVLALRGEGWRRPATIIRSILAIALNILAFLAISYTY